MVFRDRAWMNRFYLIVEKHDRIVLVRNGKYYQSEYFTSFHEGKKCADFLNELMGRINPRNASDFKVERLSEFSFVVLDRDDVICHVTKKSIGDSILKYIKSICDGSIEMLDTNVKVEKIRRQPVREYYAWNTFCRMTKKKNPDLSDEEVERIVEKKMFEDWEGHKDMQVMNIYSQEYEDILGWHKDYYVKVDGRVLLDDDGNLVDYED